MLGSFEIRSVKNHVPKGIWNLDCRVPDTFGCMVLSHDNAHDGQRLLQRGHLFTQPLHFAL